MSESQEQKALIQFCDYQNIPIFAIPNGGKRNPKEAADLKRQGVKAACLTCLFLFRQENITDVSLK